MPDSAPAPVGLKFEAALEHLLRAVQSSGKYQPVSEALIRRIGAQELAKRRNLKEAIKATKNKLHQVGGAYLDGDARYSTWLDELKAAQSRGEAELRAACLRMMRYHASTRERLPVIEKFYAPIFAGLPPVHSVLDVACGLNPLAIPWMGLAEGAEYTAVDIYRDMMDFLAGFMALVPGVRGSTEVGDILGDCPSRRFDVALALKTIPCLEQVDHLAGQHLLDSINADILIVSFPSRSLSGRSKGMPEHYSAHFHQLIADRPWKVERFEFDNELVFKIMK